MLGVILGMAPMQSVQAQNQKPSARIEFLKYGSMATTVAQSQDGQYIAIGARDVPGGGSRVVLWNRSTQQRERTVQYAANRAPAITFDSTGARLFIAPVRERISHWPLDSLHTVSTPPQGAPTAVNDLAVGFRSTVGVGAASGLKVWPRGTEEAPTALDTDRPVRSFAFSDTSPDLIFRSGPTEATLWNFRFNTTKEFSTTERCPGLVRQVEMPEHPRYFFVITQRRAECDPDYLCTISTEDRTVPHRLRRKNISHIEHIDGLRVAYSRGRHVYTLNLETRQEEIIFSSDNEIRDLSYANGRLAVANSDVVLLPL